MPALSYVVAVACIVLGGILATHQLRMVTARRRRRGRSTRFWSVISDPAAQLFRIALFSIGNGLLILNSDWGSPAGRWTVVGLVAAVTLWDRGLWLSYLIRRARRRLASH